MDVYAVDRYNPVQEPKRFGGYVLKQMQIRIYPDGKIDAKTLGIKGEKCLESIKTLERLLEARVVESVFTEEYYQAETQENSETMIQIDRP